MAEEVPATCAIIPTFPLLLTCAANASAACAPALRLLVATKLTGMFELMPESKVTTLIPREFAVSTSGASAFASRAARSKPFGFCAIAFSTN